MKKINWGTAIFSVLLYFIVSSFVSMVMESPTKDKNTKSVVTIPVDSLKYYKNNMDSLGKLYQSYVDTLLLIYDHLYSHTEHHSDTSRAFINSSAVFREKLDEAYALKELAKMKYYDLLALKMIRDTTHILKPKTKE